MSALEAAIAATSINDKIGSGDDDNDNNSTEDSRLIEPYESWFDRKQAPQYKTHGMPGYLSQKDLLVPLAPLLTTRGDTFTIRGYGESRDKTGKTLAKAWCEIVVQRTPEYIGGDDPLEPILIQDGTNYKENDKLSELSKKFGRRFKRVTPPYSKCNSPAIMVHSLSSSPENPTKKTGNPPPVLFFPSPLKNKNNSC